MNISAKLQKHHDDARKLAMTEVIRLARKIMKANPTFTCWICAMGRCVFYETTPETEDECAKDNAPLRDNDPRALELIDFVDEWDNTLKLTGEGCRLDSHDGELVTDW